MIKVSVSALRDYMSCKAKAYYRRFPDKYEKEISASMVVGSIIHDLIESHERGCTINLPDYYKRLYTDLSRGVVFSKWQTMPKITSLIETCYSNYLGIMADHKFPPIIEPEEFFKVYYDEDVQFVGRFDQWREDDVILELKTGHYEPDEKFLATDLQSSFYSYAYFLIHERWPTFYYLHLSTGSVYKIVRTDFSDMLDVIGSYVDDWYHDQMLVKEKDGYKCSRCEYRNICVEDCVNFGRIFMTAQPKRNIEIKKGSFLSL